MMSDFELVCESTPKCAGDVGTDCIVAAEKQTNKSKKKSKGRRELEKLT